MNISLLIGLKNNLEYSKYFYKTTRQLYPTVELCFVSYGSTDGTHAWLDSLYDPNVKYYYSEDEKTFADTYNKAAEIATKKYVAYLHNDIVLAPKFLETLLESLEMNCNTVISYTTIEPPIFVDHERPGKVIYDLGSNIESFDIVKFYEHVNSIRPNRYDVSSGITFFLSIERDILLSIGGMDNLFNPYFCEDDDLIYRLKLKGLNMLTRLDALCYHFVSKTSRFTPEAITNSKKIELQSNRNFIRKWGSRNPIVKYDITYYVHNCKSLNFIELFCDRLYILDKQLIYDYIKTEQPYTKYDLRKKILFGAPNCSLNRYDIIVEFDYTLLSDYSYQVLQHLPEIIKNNDNVGTFTVDIFIITINNLEEKQNDLIFVH